MLVARTVNVAERTARRDAILDAVQRLILSKGHERLTVQDILDDLQISKGAFYHYFDSKPAVIEGLTQRLVSDSQTALTPIVEDHELKAFEKLQQFFNEIIRWKSLRQNLFVAMLPVWYSPDNLPFRVRLDMAVAEQLAPLLTAIVRQGVDEQVFVTAYPEHAGPIIIALIQSLQDAMAQQLLELGSQSRSPARAKDMVAAYGAHIEAIERYLGIPAGTLYRADSRAVNNWIAARRRAQ
ncbi:TetR/AcrR family transcriptional regulator [Mycobacterium sp. OTB74]|jgi:AcrR family transcriptional regulator|uniref:TetR/AcrR family transcriptional regulator n=1 Tax=Mycobacterium sp. OTB74 TaxID=1853452 RepID=UPI00247564E1|nr:TetR/AcrR family transcriptional regulator [Mycobacterium sp. OTB74]MDH6245663.1 AcrR family transcriptional regulator [Mycobacterium sp. OTB74]